MTQPNTTPAPEAENAIIERVTREAVNAAQLIKFPLCGGKGEIPFVLLPDGRGAMRVESLAHLLPTSRAGSRTFNELASFAGYVNEFKDERTKIFCRLNVAERTAVFVATLDYHLPSAKIEMPHPLWGKDVGERCQHTAKLVLQWTPEAMAWLKREGTAISQADFAEFLEDHYPEVIEPSGAELLEVAKTLEAKNDVAFKSAQRQSDGGYNLQYEETIAAKAGTRGDLTVPSDLTLRMALFAGCEPVTLRARVRFRLSQGGIHFSYKLHQFDRVVTEVFDDVREAIRKETLHDVWSEA